MTKYTNIPVAASLDELEAVAAELKSALADVEDRIAMRKRASGPVGKLRELYFSRKWPSRAIYLHEAHELGLNRNTAATYWHKFAS